MGWKATVINKRAGSGDLNINPFSYLPVKAGLGVSTNIEYLYTVGDCKKVQREGLIEMITITPNAFYEASISSGFEVFYTFKLLGIDLEVADLRFSSTGSVSRKCDSSSIASSLSFNVDVSSSILYENSSGNLELELMVNGSINVDFSFGEIATVGISGEITYTASFAIGSFANLSHTGTLYEVSTIREIGRFNIDNIAPKPGIPLVRTVALNL